MRRGSIEHLTSDETVGTGTVYYGSIPVECCGACCAAYEAIEVKDMAILSLDPFNDPTGLLHIEMDDGKTEPLCEPAKKAWRER